LKPCTEDQKSLKKWQRGVIKLSDLNIFSKSKKDVVKLGIDVGDKYNDIRRLFYKKYAKVSASLGEDPEDVLQEVFKGILLRNRGKCPFDPRKAAFSTYVMMVCHCVTSNYFKKTSETNKRKVYLEDIEYKQPSDGGAMGASIVGNIQIKKLRDFFSIELRDIFDMLMEGYSMTEISRTLSYTPRELRKRVDKIRKKVDLSVDYSV
jgi:DNA-directed RNA polymerase specialized sigma24 family protein